MKKNILHVIGGLNRAGAETMLMNIFRKIDRNNYQFYFLVFYPKDCRQDYQNEIESLGGKIIHLEEKNLMKNLIKAIRIYKENKIDVVHAHTLFNSSIYLLAAKICKISIRITHSHSTGQMKKENLVMKTYMTLSRTIIKLCSTHFVACGKEAGIYLFGDKIFNKKGIVIKNAIDSSVFFPREHNPNYLKQNNEKLKIGCIGSFYEVKNHVFLVGLANYMINEKKFTNFNFIFVGKGYLEEKLKSLIKEEKLEKYFTFLGTRTDISNLMNFFDVLVMPSLYEGIPVTLIEAQASGLPCIISNKISNEVDLDLNLVTFCDIDENYEEWYQSILENKDKYLSVESSELIQKKLSDSGYSLESNIQTLLSIYMA